MFLNTIEGLNRVFDIDIPEGMIILVVGGPGTLKSSFVYNLLSLYLSERKDEFGTYITLEETKEDHLRNMTSLNIPKQKRLRITDLATLRHNIGYEDIDFMSLIQSRAFKKAKLSSKKQKKGDDSEKSNFKVPTCFALDSLNALYSLTKLPAADVRQEMLKFFSELKKAKMTSFVLLETGTSEIYRDEFFLVDGIIELGVIQHQGQLKRYFMIKKMRSTKHSLERYVMELTKNGIRIVGQITPGA
jgi:KaiC/GvpD/RAD55 family RecA-like ATPase